MPIVPTTDSADQPRKTSAAEQLGGGIGEILCEQVRPGSAQALVSAPRVLDQRRRASGRLPASTSASVSPTIHELERSSESSRAASSSMPGAGLRHAQNPRARRRRHRDGAGTAAKRPTAPPPRRAARSVGGGPSAAAPRRPRPWQQRADWRRTRARSRPGRARASRQRLRRSGERRAGSSGDSARPSPLGTISLRTPSRSRKTAGRPLTAWRCPEATPSDPV